MICFYRLVSYDQGELEHCLYSVVWAPFYYLLFWKQIKTHNMKNHRLFLTQDWLQYMCPLRIKALSLAVQSNYTLKENKKKMLSQTLSIGRLKKSSYSCFTATIDYSRITFAEKRYGQAIPAFNSRGKGVSPCSDQWLMPVEKFQSYCQSAQSSWKMIGSICNLWPWIKRTLGNVPHHYSSFVTKK